MFVCACIELTLMTSFLSLSSNVDIPFLSSDQVLAGVDPNTSYSEDLLPQLTQEAERDTQPLRKCIIYGNSLICNFCSYF